LEKTEVAKGGFCIALKPEEIVRRTSNINDRIKQVRWHQKRLVSGKYGKSLNDAETQLLYEALCRVFDSDCVKIQN